MTRCYLAGPMRGIPRWNFDRFHEVTGILRSRGYIVISPAEVDEALGLNPNDYPILPDWWTIEQALVTDKAAIDRSDIVVLLEGWEDSAGVRAELKHAFSTGKRAYELDFTADGYGPRFLSVSSISFGYGALADGIEAAAKQWGEQAGETFAQEFRTFSTGADRDTDVDKLNFDGFLSPDCVQRFAQYMHKCRIRNDGTQRSADNWKKGIPLDAYMESMWRHFFAVWNDFHNLTSDDVTEDLCALLFNVQGMLHERLKEPA